MRKYIQLRKVDFEKENIPFSPRTLYRWYQRGRYKEIFTRIGNRVLLDVEKFQEILKGGNL